MAVRRIDNISKEDIILAHFRQRLGYTLTTWIDALHGRWGYRHVGRQLRRQTELAQDSIVPPKLSLRGNIQSASSYARPAPKPRPTQAGQALRLKRRTERTTPNPRPIDERTIKDEMARSHYELKIELVGTVHCQVEWQRLSNDEREVCSCD